MMLRRAGQAILGALLLAMSAPAHADTPEYEAFLATFTKQQEQDRLLANVSWQLVAGNARYCTKTAQQTGLVLQDASAYARPDWVRQAVGIEGDIFVQAASDNSPAVSQGPLVGTDIRAIEGRDVRSFLQESDAGWERLERIRETMNEAANRSQSVTVGFAAKTPLTFTSQAVCDSRFEMTTGDDTIGTDGHRVRIGASFPGFAYSQEEFAAAMAHELAHNLLKHREWLAANGNKRRDIRRTEREADRLMPWLLFNARYEPEAAVKFMKRWGEEEDSRFLAIRRTHDGWDERVELIEAEIATLRQVLAEKGKADWSKDFVREPKR